MKFKNALIGTILITVGYQVGKAVGYIRCGKAILDVADEVIPGVKKTIAKVASEKIIDSIFESQNKEDES